MEHPCLYMHSGNKELQKFWKYRNPDILELFVYVGKMSLYLCFVTCNDIYIVYGSTVIVHISIMCKPYFFHRYMRIWGTAVFK